MGHLWTAAPGCSSILCELGVVCYREGPCLFSGGRELEETMQGWALVLDWETECGDLRREVDLGRWEARLCPWSPDRLCN